MRKFLSVLALGLFLLSGTMLACDQPAPGPVPQGATIYSWCVNGDGIFGSGTLTTGPLYSNGMLGITDFTGTFSDTNNGINGTIIDPFTANGTKETSPDGLYWYDQLFAVAGTHLTDTGGVLFNVTTGTPGVVDEVNIAAIPGNTGYYLWETTPGHTYLPGQGAGYVVNFDKCEQSGAVPEPMTLGFVGAGLLGLGLVKRNKKQ